MRVAGEAVLTLALESLLAESPESRNTHDLIKENPL